MHDEKYSDKETFGNLCNWLQKEVKLTMTFQHFTSFCNQWIYITCLPGKRGVPG